jgi:septal ring factor EnvC (AmiA/AmiB activator)
MSVFFQFIAGISLFFGIGAIVFATEISKRCQQLIDMLVDEIENETMRRLNKQDKAVGDALQTIRTTISNFEDTQFSQSRDINALRKALEALTDDLQKRAEEEKKQLAILARRRRA